MARLAAALVAIVCWAGLAVQFSATYANQPDVLATLWILARFFTIITNLILAVTMTWVATGGRASPTLLGGATLAILLVGAIYMFLLQGLYHLSGGAHVADILLHKVSPLLMALWWLLFAPRARLRWSAPLWWGIYPVAYLGYALGRGQIEHKYPYPFIDVGHIGWTQTALNVGGIAFGFVLAGLALVWIDSWRPLGSRRSNR
ncbi:MAG: Pr6Pr family membrane protein [Sphingomicrobium sp.]